MQCSQEFDVLNLDLAGGKDERADGEGCFNVTGAGKNYMVLDAVVFEPWFCVQIEPCIPCRHGGIEFDGEERMRWSIQANGAGCEGLVPVPLPLPGKKRQRDVVAGGGKDALPGNGRAGQMKSGKAFEDGGQLGLIAAQGEEDSSAGRGLGEGFRDSGSERRMSAEFNKAGMALGDKPRNCGAETYRLADVTPPIFGGHIQAVDGFSGDRGPEGELSGGCFNLPKGAKQAGFGRVHLATVEGVTDLNEAVESAALI